MHYSNLVHDAWVENPIKLIKLTFWISCWLGWLGK